MKKTMTLSDSQLSELMGYLPGVTSQAYYFTKSTTGTTRFPSVFKMVKEDLKNNGIDFTVLDEGSKYEIMEIVKDAYYGIRDGE